MIPFEDMNSSRFRWFFLAGGIFCLIAAFSLAAFFGGKFAPPDESRGELPEFEVQEESPVSTSRWVVYVTGAVMRPGVYEVPAGSRINDALRKAGGFSVDADPEAINLAERIEDGMHIRIPAKGEGTSETIVTPRNAHPQSSTQSGVPTAGLASQTGRIDINRASATELQGLPGIGPKLSQTIVDYRNANGSFETTEVLKNIRGIGEKRFEVLRDLVTVSK